MPRRRPISRLVCPSAASRTMSARSARRTASRGEPLRSGGDSRSPASLDLPRSTRLPGRFASTHHADARTTVTITPYYLRRTTLGARGETRHPPAVVRIFRKALAELDEDRMIDGLVGAHTLPRTTGVAATPVRSYPRRMCVSRVCSSVAGIKRSLLCHTLPRQSVVAIATR